jgi:Uma2 family endonuclease
MIARMAEPAHRKLTVDEFLAWDDGTDRRYELVRGEIVAMAPPSQRHGTIVALLAAALIRGVPRECRVVVEAGIRLADRDDTYYQADLAITCAPPSGSQHVPEPRLIVEVLSPSTAQHDRGTKLPDYCGIPSVEEIVAISATSREADLWRRSGANWIVSRIHRGMLRLESIGVEIDLDTVYADSGLGG